VCATLNVEVDITDCSLSPVTIAPSSTLITDHTYGTHHRSPSIVLSTDHVGYSASRSSTVKAVG